MRRPNLTVYCRDRNINHLYHRLRRALLGHKNRSSRVAINKRLIESQDVALERFYDAIDDVGFRIIVGLIYQHANTLLADVHDSNGDRPPL